MEGKRVSGTVRVVNPTNAPLHVSQVVTSCGCTTTGKLSVIPAHGFAPLDVAFDSTGRPGTIEKQVSIFTRESPDAPVVFTLGGTVKSEWQVSPSETLNLGTIAGGDTKTAIVAVSRVSGGAVSFAKPVPVSGVSAVVSPNADAKTATVRVTVAAPRVPGSHKETVTLTPTDADLPAVKLQVAYTATGPFAATPDVVNFGLVGTNAALLEKTVTVAATAATGTVPKLTVVSAPKGVAVRVESAPSGKVTLRVMLSPGALSVGSVLNERIVLATGSEKQPQIVVPVLAALKERITQ